MDQLPPLSLYVHIPWCVRKCPYCDFNSHESKELPEQAYLDTLKRDLIADLPYVQDRKLHSIFFGGGTPSLMSGEFYQKFLSFIEENIPFSNDIEITLEANPGTTEASRFQAYRKAGINRLSMGVQSFQDAQLKHLGRIHSSEEAIRAFQQAREAGFDNINLDLMHGLPDQSLALAMEDLKQAIDLKPEHLSWYQLTIEKNTEFYSSPPVLPEEEILWDIQEAGFELLKNAGYKQYEVSAFAQQNKQAKHNLNYWQFGDYIGIGAGAHSKISTLGDSKYILRYRKSRIPKDYMKPRPLFRVGEETIPESDLPFEFMMNVLRLNEGVETPLFQARTGLSVDVISTHLQQLREQALLHPERLQATEKGHLFLNSVLEQFSDE